jgi:hypothetical protein
MKQSKPTNEQWTALYEAAAAFKELAPWQWMYDSDLFGVQDPETGEVGYCCVLGALGELLGLNVHRGRPGIGGVSGNAGGIPGSGSRHHL